MTSMNRSALLWAGLLTILTLALTGCGEGPDMIVDGGMCQNMPWTCPGDSSTEGGHTCVPSGDEADHCDDLIDNDCDGETDSGDSDCGGTCPGFAIENTMELCTDGVDNDCNGSQDNVMHSGDPNCEPMSCSPGSEPGPDLLETLRPPGECFENPTWPNELVPDSDVTYIDVMNFPDKTWTCSPPGCTMSGCGQFNTTMAYGYPTNLGYEPGAVFDSGDMVLGTNLDFVLYVDEDNHARFTFAPDALSGNYVRTINGVTTTYTCQ